uniref:Uncharacterized protein n=1 Tax=Arion vulgaris TaxID=1028688 RepID=A0A0B6ZVT4_9EUPU
MMELPVQQENAFDVKEFESNRQKLHEMQRHIDVLTANLKHLENDNAELNNALTEVTQNRKDSLSYDHEKSDLKYRQRIEELQQMLEETQTSERDHRETEKKLQHQLRLALEAAASTIPQIVDNDDEMTLLQLQISELKDENSSLKLKLYENATELKQKIDEVTRLQHEIIDKDEEIECIESQFATQCNISERLREEICDYRAKLEADSAHVDTQKKGNSLFAEVDDRRIVAERRIIKLELATGELEEKLTKEQKENKRLKLQILLLRQTSSKGYDDGIVANLQSQLLESKRSVVQLTEQLQKSSLSAKHKPITEVKFSAPESSTDNDKMFINFLQGIITQKTKETEDAKTLAQQNHLQALRTELRLTEVKNELMTLTHDFDKLKVMNSHLTMTLQEMQRKYEPELFAPPSKAKIKIPLSDPVSNSSSQKDQQVQSGAKTNPSSTHLHHGQPQREEPVHVFTEPVGAFCENAKENVPLQNSQSDLPGAKRGKSVRMMPLVNVISSNAVLGTEELKLDGQGQKVKKVGGGTGKYKSVTHMTIDSQPTECKQQ